MNVTTFAFVKKITLKLVFKETNFINLFTCYPISKCKY